MGAASATLSSSLWPLWRSPRVRFFDFRTALVEGRLTLTDQLRLVQTSLLGSVLSNLLLVLGMSFFA
jgi:hypothetical protein